MTDPFELSKGEPTQGQLRRRVIRGGPYTKDNRKQLRHHLGVGAGLGGSAGAAVGAHLGAHAHSQIVRDAERVGRRVAIGRGKASLVIAGIVGSVGAAQGAAIGSDVARGQRREAGRKLDARRPRKVKVAKADHSHAKEAVAATAGAATTGTAYQAGGYKMKLVAQKRGAKAPAGISRSKYEKTIKEHQRAHGAYHGGAPEWLGQRGRVGHTIGLATGQGPTAHVNAARHWPTKIEGVSVPGARVRRVMGYTHGGKTGLAVGATAAALGAGSALAAEHHHLHKSEPLAIAGKLWRKPTVRSEFRRAFSGTRKGEKTVNQAARTPKTKATRNQWGYPSGHRVVGNHGGDARAALSSQIQTEARHSPHSTGFKLGAGAATATSAAGRTGRAHPEFAISIPSAGAGVGLAHHEIKRSKNKTKKKGTPVSKLIAKTACKDCAACKDPKCSCAGCKGRKMSKSAFGVEKGMLTSGLNAMKGFKGGLSGVVGAERTSAGAAGKVAGAKTMGKLKPVVAAATKTPLRTATVAGTGGLAGGMALGDGKRN